MTRRTSWFEKEFRFSRARVDFSGDVWRSLGGKGLRYDAAINVLQQQRDALPSEMEKEAIEESLFKELESGFAQWSLGRDEWPWQSEHLGKDRGLNPVPIVALGLKSVPLPALGVRVRAAFLTAAVWT